MQAGTEYMECHNKAAGILYRNMCTQYGLEDPQSECTTPPRVVENHQPTIQFFFIRQICLLDRKFINVCPQLVLIYFNTKIFVAVIGAEIYLDRHDLKQLTSTVISSRPTTCLLDHIVAR